MRSYTNRSLEAAEIITEPVELAKQMRGESERGTPRGLRDDELAFHDAVCQNNLAVLELGDDALKGIARELPSCDRTLPLTGTRRIRCVPPYVGVSGDC
jgi:type I restriction enzyme, R subunit